MESKHQDPNVYIIKPVNGKGPVHTVNQWQLFDVHKSQGSDMPSNPAYCLLYWSRNPLGV